MTALAYAPTPADARHLMVECQIRPFSVIDERVLAAFRNTPREEFLPQAAKAVAYLGEDLNMGKGRFLLEPAMHARALQEAQLQPNWHVLDVGCLQAYSSVILSQLVGHVTGFDTAGWIDAAENTLQEFVCGNVDLLTGDLAKGPSGLGGLQKYDAIVFNGAIGYVPTHYAELLRENGVILAFHRGAVMGEGRGEAVLYRKINGTLQKTVLFDAFVPALPGFEQPERFVF